MHVHACCIIKFKHHVYHTKTKSVYILWDEKKIIIIIVKYLNLSVCTSLYTWRRASMRIHTCIYSARSFFFLRITRTTLKISKVFRFSKHLLLVNYFSVLFVRIRTDDGKHETRPPRHRTRREHILYYHLISSLLLL